jgi:hypothetical protein
MALRDDVQTFLNEFKVKARTFGIDYYPRQKNTDALLQLGITANIREEIVMKLEVRDYYRGPTGDIDPKRSEFYEFGAQHNGQEIYVKLSLGKFSKSPHCMSFHLPEAVIDYPLR